MSAFFLYTHIYTYCIYVCIYSMNTFVYLSCLFNRLILSVLCWFFTPVFIMKLWHCLTQQSVLNPLIIREHHTNTNFHKSLINSKNQESNSEVWLVVVCLAFLILQHFMVASYSGTYLKKRESLMVQVICEWKHCKENINKKSLDIEADQGSFSWLEKDN